MARRGEWSEQTKEECERGQAEQRQDEAGGWTDGSKRFVQRPTPDEGTLEDGVGEEGQVRAVEEPPALSEDGSEQQCEAEGEGPVNRRDSADDAASLAHRTVARRGSPKPLKTSRDGPLLEQELGPLDAFPETRGQARNVECSTAIGRDGVSPRTRLPGEDRLQRCSILSGVATAKRTHVAAS